MEVVAAGVSTSPSKAQRYLTQQQSSTKCEGPSEAQHLEGSSFPRKSAAFTPKPASPKSCCASFRHISLGSNRSASVHGPVMHRVDVSMPFPASKMSGLLKESFKKYFYLHKNRTQSHTIILGKVWKEEIFKHLKGIGTEPGPFWGRKTKKCFTKCESKEKCLSFYLFVKKIIGLD